MATTVTVLHEPPNGALVIWEDLGPGETGDEIEMYRYPDRTVIVSGDGSVAIQGSNDRTSWANLTDDAGVDLALADGDIVLLIQNPVYLRPVVTGGSSTKVSITGVR